MNFFQKHRKLADNINRYTNVVKNIAFIISLVLSGVSKLVKVAFVRDILTNFLDISEKQLDSFSNKQGIAFVFLTILILWSFCAFVHRAIQADINNKVRDANLVRMIHKDFIHTIRSYTVELDSMEERIKKHQDDSSLYNEELDKLKNNIQPYVDILERYLSSYRNQKVAVCIKTFLNGGQVRDDYMKEELITIVRSKVSKRSRNSNHRAVVGKNTDFIDLCCGKSTFFGRCGLKELYNNGLYFNDSHEWWKKYNSTLVLPIRYYDKDAANGKMNINFDIIGFLCIDCKDDVKEWESSDSFELQLMAIVADSLYTYLRKFYDCFKKVNITVYGRN